MLREKKLMQEALEAEKANKKYDEEEGEEEEEELIEGMGEEFEGEEEEYVDPDPVLTAARKLFYDLAEQIRIKRSLKEYVFEKSAFEVGVV